MNILNVIDKLELIKHYHLINVLEKYTEQVAATTATATPPAAATTATATPPAAATTATATPTSPSLTPAPPAPPVPVPTKPEEEVKKAAEFENNMMDSLKWVFIAIAIFVFILIILGVVYWLMFGSGSSSSNSSSNENTIREDDVNGMNRENELNGMNGVNDEMNNYNPPPEPYQEPSLNEPADVAAVADVDNNTSMFSSLSAMSPFSSSSRSVSEPMPEQPVVIQEPVSTPVITEPVPEPIPVIKESIYDIEGINKPVSPVSVVPVMPEVKK